MYYRNIQTIFRRHYFTLAQRYGANKAVGVDIDEDLVRAAWARRRKVWSLQQPPDASLAKIKIEGDSPHILAASPRAANYFPASLPHQFGPLPIPTSAPDEFPGNVTFRHADWPKDGIHEDQEGYDVIIA